MIPKDDKKDDMTARIDLDEDGKDIDQDEPEEENTEETLAGALLTEEILRRIYSFRLNPWNPKLKDKEKGAWLTTLPLLEHRSHIHSLAKNRYAIVHSHDQKPFKISTKSVTARDMDVTATSAFDMAMAASLNPKMIKKGVTVTAVDPSAAFLLMFAVQKSGLHIANMQQLSQLAQAHPDAFNAAKQQWEAAYPQLSQAFNEKSAQTAASKPQAQPVKQEAAPIVNTPTGIHTGKVPDWNPDETAEMIRKLHEKPDATEPPEDEVDLDLAKQLYLEAIDSLSQKIREENSSEIDVNFSAMTPLKGHIVRLAANASGILIVNWGDLYDTEGNPHNADAAQQALEMGQKIYPDIAERLDALAQQVSEIESSAPEMDSEDDTFDQEKDASQTVLKDDQLNPKDWECLDGFNFDDDEPSISEDNNEVGLRDVFAYESDVAVSLNETEKWSPSDKTLQDIVQTLSLMPDATHANGVRQEIADYLPILLEQGEEMNADDERVSAVVDKLLERGFLEQDESGNLSLKQKSTTPAADSKLEI